MAEIDSRTWTGRYPTLAASSVIISARLTKSESGQTRESFWDAYRGFVRSTYPGHAFGIQDFSADQFEQRIRQEFPQELGNKLRSSLESYLTRSSISRELNAEQKRVLQGINLSVARIFYGSIDVETIIENLDSIVGTLGVSVDVLTTMLILNSPDALNAALYTPGAEWTVAIPDVNIPNPSPLQTPSPSPSPMPVTAGGPRESLAQIYDSTRFWRLLNALWVLPILVSLIVLVLTYQEMNRIIALRDTDRSKVLSDEISTASARSDRFFEQQALLLQRHETFFKEATETIKVVLSDEIKRVAARSDNFDKQQAALLERYENLSKESSDIVRIRLQNAGGCYKPRRCSPVSSKLVVKDPALRTGH